MPIKVVRSDQTCALGSAISAAVAAGIYASVPEAQYKMASDAETEYHPVPENVIMYEDLFKKYRKFGEFIEKEF